jgi:hypothetical protein
MKALALAGSFFCFMYVMLGIYMGGLVAVWMLMIPVMLSMCVLVAIIIYHILLDFFE